MAKTLVKTTQELVNYAQQYRIETEGKSIQDVAQELIDKLMSYYEEYYTFIDNGRQYREAEQNNRRIEEEVAAIEKLINTLPVQEDTTMTTENTTTNNSNETTTTQEETVMRETLAERLLNIHNKVERIMYVWNIVLHCDEKDPLFITTEELGQFLFDSDISGRSFTKEDYEKEIGEKPLGEFVREIVGLEMNAAKEAFSEFLDETNLDSRQIYFVNQIVEYIVHNGMMKDLSVLQESPFTDKGSVVELFQDINVWMGIRKVIDQINANAVA
jgi:hypothetical protein